MAEQETKAMVSLEKIIHRELQDVLQRVWDEHGIAIERIDANWIDVSTAGEHKMILRDMGMNTFTKVG